MNNNGTLGQRNHVDYLQQNADTLFTLGPLRKTLWTELRKSMSTTLKHAEYFKMLSVDKLPQMAWDMMRLWQSTIGEIHNLHDNLFPHEDFVMTMLQLRHDVIVEFAQTKPSSWWPHVSATDVQTIRTFANRLYHQLPEKDIARFYHHIDMLGILTDLINHRDHLYDMKLDYRVYAKHSTEQRKRENEQNKLTDDKLRKAVMECNYLFWGQVSWYVVYAICVEDYKFKNNMAAFERYIQELNMTTDYGCPKDTLQSALSSNECFKYPSSEWQEYHAAERIIILRDKMREALKKYIEESEKSDDF